MEHPQIEQALKTGYPEKIKSYGTDFFGNEILEGDEIVVTPDGENVLADSLEDYLIEILGFRFIKAEE
jgi:hypothetical protein